MVKKKTHWIIVQETFRQASQDSSTEGLFVAKELPVRTSASIYS
jgi:hypothetical protein